MEQQQSSKKKLSKMAKFSVVLSYMIAVFAILSLIAAGFSQISYAAPTDLDEDLTFYHAVKNGDLITVVGYTNDNESFEVPYYQANDSTFGSASAIRIFCLEHKADIPLNTENKVYSKSESVNDGGLLYILNKSRILGGSGIVTQQHIDRVSGLETHEGEDAALIGNFMETYVTQVAIWVYMNENYGSSSERFTLADSASSGGKTSEQNLNIIKNQSTLDVPGMADYNTIETGNLYDIYIKKLVDEAKDYSAATISLSRADKSISKVGDDGFYQTSAINVSGTPSEKFKSFDVTVEGIDGAFVVDSKGNTKTHFDISQENANRDEPVFYIRVPADKVTDATTLKGNVSVSGSFADIGAQVYGSGDYQRVVRIGGPAEAYAKLPIDFATVPPTGMSKAQTIYFIGLIVLLCGVGIVYANAKPAQSEE